MLLSRIYDHLNSHIGKHSPRVTIASVAYILETSSHDYLKSVCQSVGISETTLHLQNVSKSDLSPISTSHQDNIACDSEEYLRDAEFYPTFFPPYLAASLTSAKKSLRILRAAQADHPIFNDTTARDLEWVWTEEEIGTLWLAETNPGTQIATSEGAADRNAHLNCDDDIENKTDRVLADFCIFDQEPGTHLVAPASTDGLGASSTHHLRKFLAAFPDSLPAITPTLQHLTSLVFTPLITHTERLSSSLLSVFLSHSSTLHFQTHLVLLRSYLLLTSHPFKSRINAALFSDAGDAEPESLPVLDFTAPSLSVEQTEARPWAVGLVPSLIKRDSWPPGGADLSFLLRTVIVDSLELDRDAVDTLSSVQMASPDTRRAIFDEAEYRLGFAIRDLPTGPGRDRWLNPLCKHLLRSR